MNRDDERKDTHEDYRRPLVDVFETDDDVVLQLELPGIESDQIDVSTDGDLLKVQTKSGRQDAGDGRMLLKEFVAADFYREFVLSRQLDRENIAASWNDGVLTLKVAKGAAKKHRIEIAT